MQIRADTLTQIPLRLTGTTPDSEWDMGSAYFDLAGEVILDCAVSKVEDVVTIKADVEYTAKVVCARCLEVTLYPVKKTYTIYVPDCVPQALIDVKALVREELLLEYPLKTLCREHCKGMCSTCGKNLNNEACLCKKED
jgi:uncharacterized protein